MTMENGFESRPVTCQEPAAVRSAQDPCGQVGFSVAPSSEMISVLSRAEMQPDQRTAGSVVPGIRKELAARPKKYHPKYHPFTRAFGSNFFILMEPPAGLEPATC